MAESTTCGSSRPDMYVELNFCNVSMHCPWLGRTNWPTDDSRRRCFRSSVRPAITPPWKCGPFVSPFKLLLSSYSDGEDHRLEVETGLRDMRLVLMIVRQILTPTPSEVLFVRRDDIVHQLAAGTADAPFRDSVLHGLRKHVR